MVVAVVEEVLAGIVVVVGVVSSNFLRVLRIHIEVVTSTLLQGHSGLRNTT